MEFENVNAYSTGAYTAPAAPAPKPQPSKEQDAQPAPEMASIGEIANERLEKASAENSPAESYVQEHRVSQRTLDRVISEANKKLAGTTSELSYSIHSRTKEIMIKVIDKDTKKVIREIPPEKDLDAVARIWEMAGILVDEKR